MKPRESRAWARQVAIVLISAFVLFGLTGTVLGRETAFWTIERGAEFLKGTPECVSVRKSDAVSLALELDTLAAGEEGYFWCLARDARGNLYAGSGDGGNVYKFDSRGRSSLVLDSPELEVLSLAVDRNDCVYAGTSPGGLIYKIRPGGESSIFFKSGESYVWCLAFDQKGNLYAGTGERGKVYKIRPDGSSEVFYETGEKHVMCAKYVGGKLVVGTEGSGLVISVSEQGKGQVLYDCDEKEVRDLVAGEDGVIYAAAVSQSRKNIAQQEGEPGAQESDPGAQEQKQVVSSIYRIGADGAALRLWTSARTSVYSLYLAAKDSLIIGTGDEGTIFGLANGKLELLEKVADSQILDMIAADGTLLFSTGNRARVYSAGPLFCREGSLISNVFDAVRICNWGSLTWDGQVPRGGALAFSVRAGNCEKPDKTWSDWSDEITSSGGLAKSFPGRFVQWKAVLRSANGRLSPLFRKVTLAYLEKNIAPAVPSVQVLPQSVSFLKGGMDKTPERISQKFPGGIKVEYSITSDDEGEPVEDGIWARSFRTAIWQASDPNDDRLTFSVFYRGADEENWKLIGKDIKEVMYTWNSTSFPDGTYFLRVVASDLPDNTSSEALTADGTSLPFEIDNTPPVISGLSYAKENARIKVAGRVSDNLSPVVGLDYSLDGGEWRDLQSSDGLLDSPSEEFSFLLEQLSPGEHSVVLRARDSAHNIGTGKLRVR